MSIEKNISSRVQHKHDIEANWDRAETFIPKAGELIIYDVDDNFDYPRIKIGDGVKFLSDLKFVVKEQAPAIQFITWGEND